MSSPSARPNRGPAAGPGNRRALIDAARRIYAETGLSAPFTSVARAAGVGQGSLYRHFPDRTSLEVAIFQETLAAFRADIADERIGLDALFTAVAGEPVLSTVFVQMIRDSKDAEVVEIADGYQEALSLLLTRDIARGRVRADVDVDDVIHAASMLAGELTAVPLEDRPAAASRVRRLIDAALAAR
ncbi:helix-turn-helix domain-containing protein [Microbacterium limosum]|uniref:Helix-turn-helix domain-containing protein n=1 Tax=Microbacterium limosum TaxID=3079935 RepID=A0AAU0MIE9_9MICO|nr:helix-turn-helix domain-containing protein [Microbacterium sp. Y20]WOQ69939.1 helix-turn-helix domain-containing protein [Microbacterium sp. Y20]